MANPILTDAKVRGLKAASGQRLEVPDALVPGLRIRVTPTSKTWILRQRAGGKVRTMTIGPFGDGAGAYSLAAARTKAVAMQGTIAGGAIIAPATIRRAQEGGERVAGVVDTFMTRWAEKRIKNPSSYRWMFDKYVIPHFGDWQIQAIKRRDLADFLDLIADKHGMTTARRVGGLLKRLFKFAVSRDVIEADPAAALILPGAEVQRERTLTEDEIRALWVATDPASRGDERNKAGRLAAHPSMFPWGAYFRLLLLTGQRRGEVAGMRWADIDLKARTWALASADTKSARAHLVPLSPAVVALLTGLPRLSIDMDGKSVPSPYVLTTNGAAPISMFSKPKGWLDDAMCAALGGELSDWRIHDLRRTVSTGLARLGVDPFVRRRVLNHALQGVDAIYDQFDYLEPKRAALDLWATELDRIVNGKPEAANVVQMSKAGAK
ncbi:tyrosine-type recombinase/integrase [Novosphingobium arvoryzae]|uniref:Integrase n=1 Tax=Novosphingobium arvoryzae TaxID=1256514 RepID=A0A918VKA2_9SPHN|nr:tyrosine-type recombinase/integrase [Novosphingobium arvoryzae]GHA04514.1 integrase [Novosphingobium arvoryzae]